MSSKENKKWTVHSSEYKLKTPYLDVRLDLCTSLRGNAVDYYVVERGNAVGIVAITPANMVVLQKQYRHPVKEWLVELPAGMIDEKEDPKEAVKRELLEETGYEVADPIPLVEVHPASAILSNTMEFYLGLNAKKVGDPQYDDSEDIEQMLVDFDDAINMAMRGDIRDMDTVAALLFAKEYMARKDPGTP